MTSMAAMRIAITWVCCLILFLTCAYGNLSPSFYDKTCPQALSIVKSTVIQAISKEPRIGASLLRLHFHDCFVNGCDGSLLLDDTSTFTGEKTANPNNHSARGFGVVDKIKKKLEKACSGVVSCADILTIAARDSVVTLGGPTWNVLLGRRDSRTANLTAANNNIPAPTSNLANLTSKFRAQGLSKREMVVLSGGHTIGKARCTSFRDHIYNDSNIDTTYAKSLQAKCPTSGGDNRLSPLDYQTPTKFENNYYKNLVARKGLLHSDQQLFNGVSTDSLVTKYSKNLKLFERDFSAAMIKMGNIMLLTGSQGEIRKNCRKRN
jgi:peroxidase